MGLEAITRVEEVGARDVNRWLDAGYTLLNISNYAKAARRPDGQEYTRRGVTYIVGWDDISKSAPDLRSPEVPTLNSA